MSRRVPWASVSGTPTLVHVQGLVMNYVRIVKRLLLVDLRPLELLEEPFAESKNAHLLRWYNQVFLDVGGENQNASVFWEMCVT